MIYTNRSAIQMGRIIAFVVTTTSFVLLFSGEAHAYTDPGSGVLVWQLLVAAFVGLAFYFRKFITWLRTKKKDQR
jgi:hypothetical protein